MNPWPWAGQQGRVSAQTAAKRGYGLRADLAGDAGGGEAVAAARPGRGACGGQLRPVQGQGVGKMIVRELDTVKRQPIRTDAREENGQSSLLRTTDKTKQMPYSCWGQQ